MMLETTYREIKTPLTEDPNYGFVSGRIRFREKFLLRERDYEGLIQATSEKDFLSLLSNTPYAQFKGKDPLGVIQAAEWENHLFLKEYAHSLDLLKILLFPFDLHNLKIYRKGLKLRKDLSLFSSPFGYFSYPNFPSEIAQLAQNPSLSDDQLEVELFSRIYSLAQKFPFLAQYLSLLADVSNLLTLLRVMRFALSPFQFLPHGYFTEKFLSSLTPLPLRELPERFPSPISEILKEAIPFISEGDFGFLRLEKRLYHLLLSFLRTAGQSLFGYEVLSAYYLLKRQEIENLRRIYLSRFFYQITNLTILKELIIV
ncbi:MAG: V-type ATPase subunit [candidate division WOR-3 bacterium]